MALYAIVVHALGGAAILALVASLASMALLALPAGRAWIRGALRGQERHPIAWAFIVALIATVGSLYFSEIRGFVPCLFCWYQRIAMYPLVLVLGVGLARSDPGVWRYGLPLALIGVPMSAYHVLLQNRPTLELVQCGSGPPCSGRYVLVYGFVSIPVMAGAAFLLIIALLLAVRIAGRRSAPDPAPSHPT